MPVTPIGELIPNWPDTAASDPLALLRKHEDDPGALTEIERTVVGWLLEAIRTADQVSLTGPKDVLSMLTFANGNAKQRGTLRVPEGKWIAIPLTEQGHRILSYRPDGSRKWSFFVLDRFPAPDELKELPRQHRWLLLYGGHPGEAAAALTPDQLRALALAHPLSDVEFWAARKGAPATLWSLRARTGARMSGGSWKETPLPDQRLTEEEYPWQ